MPTRKDIKEDFPLRGAVNCSCCGTLLTAGWSKGKTKRYPYYLCRKKGCELYGKSIAKKLIEDEFACVLQQLKPTATLAKVAAAMFKDVWDQRVAQAGAMAKSVGDQIKDTEKKISDLIELVVNATHPRVISAYEKKIESLELQKLTLAER